MTATGIPLGNIQAGFGWNYQYQSELDKLSFPPDDAKASPFPFYDRWGDGFNLSQEFVILNQARALGYLAWLMAQTSLKTQDWKPIAAQISGLSGKTTLQNATNLSLSVPGVDLSSSRTVWEANGQETAFGAHFTPSPTTSSPLPLPFYLTDQWPPHVISLLITNVEERRCASHCSLAHTRRTF